MHGKEEIVSAILKSTSIGKEEAEALIKKEIEKYSGLLTENGAAILVAKSLNVKLEDKADFSKISLLREGMHGVNLKAALSYISPAKKIRRGDKEFITVSVTLLDDTGEISAKLWNDKASMLIDSKAEKGSTAIIKNAYVGSYNGAKELSLSQNSEVSFIKEGKPNAISLSALKPNMDNVDVYCRIKNIYEERKFKKDFKEGRMISFEIEDLDNPGLSMRAVAWNDAVDEIKPLSKGDSAKIESAYAKDNGNQLELHLGWRSRIIKEPEKEK